MRTEETETKNRKGTGGIVSSVLLGVAVILCLVVAIQVTNQGYVMLFGHSLFRVVTGSMEPTMPVGSILLCRKASVDSIEVSDIICFRSKESGQIGKIVTHRVVAVMEDDTGAILLETKGDANLSVDGYWVTSENLIGRVVWYTGEDSSLQKAITFVTGKIGFLGCVVLPILFLSGLILQERVKAIRKELQATMDELIREEKPNANSNPANPYSDILSEEEYQEMVARIRAELIEELKKDEGKPTTCSQEGQTAE
jgi:signal peptidase